MKQNSKIEAFTLSEMIVVLILTSIVAALAFTVLSLVQKHMFSIQANLSQQTTVNKLEAALWLDFNNYANVKYNSIEDKLILSNELEQISYGIHQDYILKDRDTFKLKVVEKQFYFDGKEKQSGHINAIKLLVGNKDNGKRVFVFKSNDAATYFE